MQATSTGSDVISAGTVLNSNRDLFDLNGAVLGVVDGSLVGYLSDVSHPGDAIEVEVFDLAGFYVRVHADRPMSELATPGLGDDRHGIVVPLPPHFSRSDAAMPAVLVAGTMHALRLAKDGGTGLLENWMAAQGRDVWRLLVHRLHWDLTGGAAPAESLDQDAASIERDVVGGTSAVVQRLSRMRAGKPDVYAGLVLSAEELIVQAYRGALGRDPEVGAFEIFGPPTRAGVPISELIDALIKSEEFGAKIDRERALSGAGASPDTVTLAIDALVEQGYRGVLGREPEAAAFEIFGAALRNGQQVSDIIRALIASPEFQENMDQRGKADAPEAPAQPVADVLSFSIDELVDQGYRGVLGRSAEPEAFEVFGASLRAGAQVSEVIEALIASPEFQTKFARARREAAASGVSGESMSDTFVYTIKELVEIGYRGVLRRDPEPAAHDIFGNALRTGRPLEWFIDELINTSECRSVRGLVPFNEHPGTIFATSELGRLSAAMERAVLTLAMGATPGRDGVIDPSSGHDRDHALAGGVGRATKQGGVSTGRVQRRQGEAS